MLKYFKNINNIKNCKLFLNNKEYRDLYLTLALFKVIDFLPTFNISKLISWKIYIKSIKNSDSNSSPSTLNNEAYLIPKKIFFYELILDENLEAFLKALKFLINKLCDSDISKKLINMSLDNFEPYKNTKLGVGGTFFLNSFEINNKFSKYIKNIEFSIIYSFHSAKILSICIEPHQNFIDNFEDIIKISYPQMTILNFSPIKKNYISITYDEEKLLKSRLTSLFDELYFEINTQILSITKGVFSINKFSHPQLYLYEYKDINEKNYNSSKIFNLYNKFNNLFINTEESFELSKVNNYLFNSNTSLSLFYNKNDLVYNSWINSNEEYLNLLFHEWNSFFSTTLIIKSYLNNFEKISIKIRNNLFKHTSKKYNKHKKDFFVFDRIYSELKEENFSIFSNAPNFYKNKEDKNINFFQSEKIDIMNNFLKVDNLKNKNKELMLENYNYSINVKLFWIAFLSLIFGILSFFGCERTIYFVKLILSTIRNISS